MPEDSSDGKVQNKYAYINNENDLKKGVAALLLEQRRGQAALAEQEQARAVHQEGQREVAHQHLQGRELKLIIINRVDFNEPIGLWPLAGS